MNSARTLGISLAFALSGLLGTAATAGAHGGLTAGRQDSVLQAASMPEVTAQQDSSEDAEEASAEALEASEDAAEAPFAPKRFPGYSYKIHFLKHMISNVRTRKLELRELPHTNQHRITELPLKKELIEKYRSRLHEVRAQLAERRAARH
jgi:hypothetical protein